ncbi:unnamed protein product [Ascophyllum nodosum]
MRLYDSLVRRLYQVNLFSPAQLRLSTILRLHEALGSPANALPAVHVAGTNGKGSVAFKMAKSLELGGVKTGLFVSPHVSCFRERMQVNGELIPEATVERLLPEIFEICETENLPATFFEITTTLAFQHFRKSGVEAIILEAGLGGRLDATNIVTPVVSIITSVGLDHTRILGNTVEEIAMEKSGIFKAGVPALVGEGCPLDLLKSVADALGSPFHRWPDVLAMPTNPRDGPQAKEDKDFDDENTRLAEAGLRLLWRSHPDLRVEEVALREGLAQRPPCRFETVKVYADVDDEGARAKASRAIDVGRQEGIVTVVLDVAHNLPAIQALFAKVTREFPGRRVRVVASFSKDKEITKCLAIILRHSGSDRIHFAEASTRRATPSATLVSTLKELTGGKVDASGRARAGDGSVRQALRDAIHEAAVSGDGEETSGKDLVLVCGSLYMMADARQELGFEEPQDSPVAAEVAGSHFRSAQENLERLGTDD